MDEPRITLRYDVDPDLLERIEEPVRTGREQTLELTVAEEQAHFVAADLVALEEKHGPPPPRGEQRIEALPPRDQFAVTVEQAETPAEGEAFAAHTRKHGESLEPWSPPVP